MAKAVISKIDVTMRPTDLIAGELFAPQNKLPIQVWGKTRTAAAIARQLAPRRTGALRQSIVARKSPAAKRSEPVYEVTSNLKYTAPMEFGFRHWRSGKFIPGHHFLRDALLRVRW